MLFDKLSNLVDFFARETSTPLKANWIEPELCLALVSLDANVRQFGSISRVKEKTERSDAKDSRRQFMLALARLLSNRRLLANGRRAVPLASCPVVRTSTRKSWNSGQTTPTGNGGRRLRLAFPTSDLAYRFFFPIALCIAAPMSAGLSATSMPAASSAATFSAAVPLPPEMMAPA